MSTKDVVKPKAKKSHKPRKDSGSLVLGTDISEEHTTLDIDQLSVPKKSRRHQLEVDVTEVGLEAPKSVETKRKLKDRRGKIGENINGVDELIVKKRKKEGEAASNAQDLTVEESAKKSKNGRVHDTFIENGGLGNSEKKKRKDRAHLGDDEPMKKKRKTSNTDFPSPDEDTTLTDQARKGEHAYHSLPPIFLNFYYADFSALIYAYSQFDDPKNWKFNKARQNWLIRNVFSDQTVNKYSSFRRPAPRPAYSSLTITFMLRFRSFTCPFLYTISQISKEAFEK